MMWWGKEEDAEKKEKNAEETRRRKIVVDGIYIYITRASYDRLEMKLLISNSSSLGSSWRLFA